MQANFFVQFGMALALGLLVGFQRERAESQVAGVRTFPLITLLGTLSATMAMSFGAWLLGVGWAALAAMVFLGNQAKFRKGSFDPGITTEVAALIMFGVGATLALGQYALALAVTGAVTVLLHWKAWLHQLVQRIGEGEFRAIMNFVLLALVILPVLPDQGYGPFGVLNPFRIWMMVVLIVGISLAAYLGYKLLGPGTGTLLTGVLGGLISSTATTVSYARRSKSGKRRASMAAAVILIASTVVFGRVLLEVAVVAPSTLPDLAPPLVAMIVIMGILSAPMIVSARKIELGEKSQQEDPAQIGTAIVFGLLYALVLLAVATAKAYLGQGALYGVAALSGLTDMDAITLSTAQMVQEQRIDPGTGWRLILVAAMSNLVFKYGAVAALGHPFLRGRIAALFGLALAAGALLLALWPLG